MNLSGLGPLGKVAGIGGISIGAVILIFNALIGAIPALPLAQRGEVITLLAILSFGIGGGGILAWLAAQVAPRHGGMGMRVVHGSMRNVLIEGFPTGIEGIHTTIDSATVRRHQFSGALLSKDGRFSKFTNTQLKEKAYEISASLLSLRTEYEKKCGPNSINIDKATSWVNTEFSKNYGEVTARLAGEILSRIEPVVVHKMSPISYGGNVVSTGKLDGMEPLQFASYFLEHIAEKLR